MARREIELRVNGRPLRGSAEPRTTLADFLRDELGLTGTHLGCEHGVCGACTILLDGRSVRSCLLFAVQAQGSELRTVEGLADPDEQEIREYLSGNLCRCTGYQNIVTAVQAAAAKLRASGDGQGG